MARLGTTVFVGGAAALLGYALLASNMGGPKNSQPPTNLPDEVEVVVKAAFYEHTVFGQGKKAPFVTTVLGVVVETDFPTGKDYRRVFRKVKRGTVVTVTVSPGENVTGASRHGCSITVDGVLRSGPRVDDDGKPVIGPEFQASTHAATCTTVAS
jgi:hypothetical protein